MGLYTQDCDRFYGPRREVARLVDIMNLNNPSLHDRLFNRGERPVSRNAVIEQPHPGGKLTGTLGISTAKIFCRAVRPAWVNGVEVSTASAEATAATSAADRFSGGSVCWVSSAYRHAGLLKGGQVTLDRSPADLKVLGQRARTPPLRGRGPEFLNQRVQPIRSIHLITLTDQTKKTTQAPGNRIEAVGSRPDSGAKSRGSTSAARRIALR